MALVNKLISTQVVFSASANTHFKVLVGSIAILTCFWSAANLTASTAMLMIAKGSHGATVSCMFPLSAWERCNNSLVIFSNRVLSSLMLATNCFCSSFNAPVASLSSKWTLALMVEIGVFNSCDMVAIKLVFAKSNSLKVVTFRRIIKCPISCECDSPVGLISILIISFSK